MLKYLLTTALVASLIAGVATYAVTAVTQTVETEVRISAQRVDGDRVEFALQQRNADGEWSERILPARRFFPAEGFVNRWANSTPITVSSEIEVPDVYVNTTTPTRSLTVDEYIAFCSDPTNQIDASVFADVVAGMEGAIESDTETLTWGRAFTGIDLIVTLWNSVAPPAVLRDFHSAQLLALTAFAQYAYVQPSSETIDVFELLIPALIALGPFQAAQSALDPQLRAQLAAAGCIEGATSDADDDSP